MTRKGKQEDRRDEMTNLGSVPMFCSMFCCLCESLVELNVVKTNKLTLPDKYLDSMTQWLNAAYNVVNLPQKMMLNWLSAVHELGK
jgi:hypothetical protein